MFTAFCIKYKHVFLQAAITILVGALCFAQGCRYGKKSVQCPQVAAVKAETKIVEKQLQNVVQEVDLAKLAKIVSDMVKSTKSDVKTVKKTVKAPDGTVTIEETTDAKRETHAETKTTSTTELKQQDRLQLQLQTDRTVDHKVEVTLVPQLRAPTWNFGVGFGVNVPALFGADAPPSYLPILSAKYVAEVRLTRRLFESPVYAGGSLSTRGDLLFVLGYSR